MKIEHCRRHYAHRAHSWLKTVLWLARWCPGHE